MSLKRLLIGFFVAICFLFGAVFLFSGTPIAPEKDELVAEEPPVSVEIENVPVASTLPPAELD